MNRIIFLLVLGAPLTSILPAQTPSKGDAKAAPANQNAAPPSNQELNIRAYIELLRTDVRKAKAQILSDVMQFDAEQAAVFWPIYKDYDSDLAKIGDEIMALVKNYAANYDSMTNEVADQLATKLLDIEVQRNSLKRTYYGKLKSALDPITAARFLQVENQLEKLIDLEIAAELPVIKGQEE
jgi:hypothetical protein